MSEIGVLRTFYPLSSEWTTVLEITLLPIWFIMWILGEWMTRECKDPTKVIENFPYLGCVLCMFSFNSPSSPVM